jgi:hypothetical protein
MKGKCVFFPSASLDRAIILLIARNQPPWDENWELNDEFFKQMERWEKDHPELGFVKVLEKVTKVIEIGQPFFKLIPNAPFPARSLVQSLTHLLQLGVVSTVPFIS